MKTISRVMSWVLLGLLVPVAGLAPATEITDLRDGKLYPTVTIGSQTWLAENLSFDTGQESRCLAGLQANCEQYGRLYTWLAAMRACPAGWRLASEADWQALERSLGMTEEQVRSREYRGRDEGTQLRDGGTSGFSILLSGYMRPDGTPRRARERAAFWTATEHQPGATS